MKKTLYALLTMLAALVAGRAAAQDYRVEVSAGGEPVGYAYVLVGESVLAMTDAEGAARLPASRVTKGTVVSARFVGMESVPLTWDGSQTPGATIRLELLPNVIDNVVVTARVRDRSRQTFRRNVTRVPTHGWYTGFSGDYRMRYGGTRPWTSEGHYVRNHVPGQDANLQKIDAFSLRPSAEKGAVLPWQIQRNILTVCGIAERAVQFGEGGTAEKSMVISHRGVVDGQHVFLIVKPYFDSFSGSDDSFQTIVRINPTSGIVTSSETVSRTRFGIWTVSARYAVYDSGLADRSGRFIYVTGVEAGYKERNPDAEDSVEIDVAASNIVARHFTPNPVPTNER
ncbi:MAG: hypothetical protein LBU98_00110 [Alistipes sp.]|jgi:hypothetical protein|nr:hypothetical protein [Alistipes sp.]